MTLGTGISAGVAIPYVEIVNCCDTNDRGLYNIEGFNPLTFQEGVYVITGLGFPTGQIIFNPDNCYVITYPGNAGTPYPAISLSQFAQFTLSSTDIENGCAECINCNPVFSKLVFTSCCGQSVIETQGPLPAGFLSGGLINYTGTPANGFENFCYKLSVVSNIPAAEYGQLQLIPLQSQYNTVSINGKATCEEYKLECPTCEDPQCYTLVNCEGTYFNTWFDLSDYVGDYIEIEEQVGTWFVIEQSGNCNNAIITVTVLGSVDPCPCLCYEVIGTLKKIQYVNCDNEVIKDLTATKFCSRIYPIFSGTPGQYQILQGKDCVDGLCPLVCYTLTNCSTDQIIYSQSQLLYQYFNTGSVVTLLGYEGCWKITETSSTNCDCLIVTVENKGVVTEYTANAVAIYPNPGGYNVYQYNDGLDNYYIWFSPDGWVITRGGFGPGKWSVVAYNKDYDRPCPDSIDGKFTWILNRIDAKFAGTSGKIDKEFPKNIQTEKCPDRCDCPIPVTVTQSYGTCSDCLPIIAYKFISCLNPYVVKYSIEDFSSYVGKVVKLKCGDCWTVEQINYTPPSLQTIDILFTYDSCSACAKTYYKLTNCLDPLDIIYTGSVLNLSASKVSKLDASPNPAPAPTDCDCISITYQTEEGSKLITIQVLKDGPLSYTFDIGGVEYILSFITRDGNWLLQESGSGNKIAVLKSDNPCPFGTYQIFAPVKAIEINYLYSFSVAPCTKTKTVVRIKECEGCWIAEQIDYPEGPITSATVVEEFESCIDCGVPSVCECTKVTNLNQTKKTYTYYDCDNVLQSIKLKPGESSDKVCALYWVTEPLFCSCIMFEIEGRVYYYAFIIPGKLVGGKPVYTICKDFDFVNSDCGTLYWDGTNWVIEDIDGTVLWILSSSTSGDCPYGEWRKDIRPPKPGDDKDDAAPAILTSLPCDIDICTCIQVSIDNGKPITFYTVAIDNNGYPVYTDGFSNFIFYELELNKWVAKILGFGFTLNVNSSACPIGTWTPEKQSTQTVVSTACPPTNNEFTVFDHFEVFGECKNGVCPPPVFKNNRTVRPGYNTPICTPAKYDEITCRFADIMYKIVLEKRYGITNCCPDEDDRWLVQKELIDLQALKDPNYICPSCPCSCNSGKTCSTCNCKK